MCSSINSPSICYSSWIAFQQRRSLLEGKASRPGPGQKQQLRSIRRVLWQLLMQLHPGGCTQLSRMLMMMTSKTSSSSHPSLIHLLYQVLLPPHLLHPLPQCLLLLVLCAQFVYQLFFVFYTMIDLYCLQPKHTNHVYLFYKEVDYNASGTWGEPGDKHFKCHHGPGKILTITKKMQSSLNG